MFVVFLYLFITFGISYFNASQVGRYWTEKSELPAMSRLLLWSGAIMATCGFFVVYVLIITMAMYDINAFPFLADLLFEVKLEPAEVKMMVEDIFSLSYLVIIFPILGSGLVITVNSWIVAKQRRDLVSGGIAVYNTGAQIYNSVNALKHVPGEASGLLSDFGKMFKNKDTAKGAAMLILILIPVIISLGSAIATTAVIIRASDAKYDLAEIDSL